MGKMEKGSFCAVNSRSAACTLVCRPHITMEVWALTTSSLLSFTEYWLKPCSSSMRNSSWQLVSSSALSLIAYRVPLLLVPNISTYFNFYSLRFNVPTAGLCLDGFAFSERKELSSKIQNISFEFQFLGFAYLCGGWSKRTWLARAFFFQKAITINHTSVILDTWILNTQRFSFCLPFALRRVSLD
jgi:hypothetical protein